MIYEHSFHLQLDLVPRSAFIRISLPPASSALAFYCFVAAPRPRTRTEVHRGP